MPRAVEPIQLDPQIRLICPVGGMIVFSAAQMHSSVPNTSYMTRFSIDFRTVHLDDVIERIGAPNIDAACTGTVMRDFLRGTDLARLPEDIVGYVRRRHGRRWRTDLNAEKRVGSSNAQALGNLQEPTASIGLMG